MHDNIFYDFSDHPDFRNGLNDHCVRMIENTEGYYSEYANDYNNGFSFSRQQRNQQEYPNHLEVNSESGIKQKMKEQKSLEEQLLLASEGFNLTENLVTGVVKAVLLIQN